MSLDDDRLRDLQHVRSWFQEWREGIQKQSLTSQIKNNCLISFQCMDEIELCIIRFTELDSGLLSRIDMEV